MGIRRNSAADTAAKDGLSGDISDELISFSDLQTLVNINLLELWLSEWDTFPHTKLHKTFPRLNGYILHVLGLTEENRCDILFTHRSLILLIPVY